jgi:RNA polymerase sigma-70 factor (ECF subfamily)
VFEQISQGDDNLVIKSQQGDRSAFGELVCRHYEDVIRVVYRLCGDAQIAQDAAQEAFIRAWQALPRFRGQSTFGTWLYRIVINLCCDRQPRLQRELQALPLDIDNDRVSVEAPPVEKWMDANELCGMLHRRVDALPASYRILVLLRYVQELSYEEIATVLNMPMGTVKTGLFRAKAALRQALEASQEVLEWVN